MAAIVQIPDSLSLLRNLKSFIISSSSEIVFSLTTSGSTIISETYYPDANNRIEIDVQDVVSRYLSVSLPGVNVLHQTDAVKLFSAYVDSSPVATFRVVPAGVRKLSATPSAFLNANWLTWQPQIKQVTWNAPEYLSYYFLAYGNVKAKFYKKDGTTKIVTVATIRTSGALYTFNTMLSYLFSLSGEDTDDLYGMVDVWVESESGDVWSYTQRYIHAETMGDEHYYLCVNSLGGVDTFTFHGSCTLAPEIEHETAESGSTKLNITPDPEQKWEQNTGYVGMRVTKWLFELLAAGKQWAVMDGNAEGIVIDTSNLQMSDRQNLHSCTFSFTLCEEGRLMNISRTEGDLPSIEVPSPSGDLFFLDLRLADYPDAELEDTILFLVQSPYTESWSKTSLGALREWITNIIASSVIGRNAHSHDNKAVLDRFSDVSGEPAYDGTVLQGKEDAAGKFLRKDVADTAAGLIKFQQGAKFGEFVPGITGNGGYIDPLGNAELRSLILHEFLEVPELRYNRISIEVGNKWNAPGGGIIEDVSIDTDAVGAPLTTGIITLHLEDGEIGTVAVDDICHGIFHDGMTLANNSTVDLDDSQGNFKFTGFVSVYFRVTEILDARCQRFRYALRGVSENWTSLFHPCAAMHFVGYGNFSNSDRQKSRYSTRTYERFLTGVNTWEFSSSMIAAQFGDLTNLSVLGFEGMSGYSAYLNNIYMSGTIQQLNELDLRMEIDTNGDNFLAYGEELEVTVRVWRGFYEDVTEDVQTWSITRDSGDAADDAAWALKEKVRNFDGSITLCYTAAENDLGGNANTVSTLFIIRASLLDAESVEADLVI